MLLTRFTSMILSDHRDSCNSIEISSLICLMYCDQVHLLHSHNKCSCLPRQRYDSVKIHKAYVPELDYVSHSSMGISNPTRDAVIHNMPAHQLRRPYQLRRVNFHDLNYFGLVIYASQTSTYQNIAKHFAYRHIYICVCVWCNGYRLRKWARLCISFSWINTFLKFCIQLFSL